MKKYKNILITLSAALFLGAAIMALNSVNSYAHTDYNGDGIIDAEEKKRWRLEMFGTDSLEEISKILESKYGSEASSQNSDGESNKPAPHTHSYTTTVTKDATCTEAGEMTYTCSCGDSYTEVIPMKPHDYESTVTKEPTCTETGIETKVCKDCGDAIESVIPALGHKPGDWTVEKESTCSEEGRTVKRCKVCNEIVETMVIDKLPHTEGEWEVAQKPTLTKTGLKVVKCTECGEVLKEEVIPANTTLLYILIGLGCAALIGAIIGIVVYKRRH